MALWAGSETPDNSGNFTASRIPFACAKDSPIRCNSVQGSDLPSLGYIYSFGEDNQKDIFILTSDGVYRVVRPSRCNYACSKENAVPVETPSPTSSPPSDASQLRGSYSTLLFLFSSLIFFLLRLL